MNVLFAIAAAAIAAIPPPAPSPVASFDVGSLHVTQYSTAGRPIIFIPGLTSGPWEWTGQIAHFAPQNSVYALTLPGFDGRPPITLDLRPQLPQANVPIFLIAPYEATADAQYHLASIDAKKNFYTSVISSAPNVKIVMIDQARHFAMYDQPQAVTDAIATFL
jgi:pimeloyl-ACP methyl ester carboxylesterase